MRGRRMSTTGHHMTRQEEHQARMKQRKARREAMKPLEVSTTMASSGNPMPECVDCGVNTSPGNVYRKITDNPNGTSEWEMDLLIDERSEWYAVYDRIWRKAGNPDGCLCIGCLEVRIGRKLTPLDFHPNDKINRMVGTPRLLDRKGSWERYRNAAA